MNEKNIASLLKKHEKLTHSENMCVTSHVQRETDEWFINTLMIKGCSAPFRYMRKKRYKSLEGAKVNLTYYPVKELVGGMEIEVMKVIRIRQS